MRQNLETLQGNWNRDLPKDVAKDAKGQDLMQPILREKLTLIWEPHSH